MACKYETKSGRCGLKVCYAYKHTCYTRDCCKCWEPVTNADRIRAMSDEELAEFAIMSSKFFCTKKHDEVCEKPMGCTECAFNWLQQPALEVADEADT